MLSPHRKILLDNDQPSHRGPHENRTLRPLPSSLTLVSPGQRSRSRSTNSATGHSGLNAVAHRLPSPASVYADGSGGLYRADRQSSARGGWRGDRRWAETTGQSGEAV